jgi:hypothetical protein
MPESFRPEIETQNQNESVQYAEIAELEKPIENIFSQLADEIKPCFTMLFTRTYK